MWWSDDEYVLVYLYQQSIIHQVITDRPRDIWYAMNICSANYVLVQHHGQLVQQLFRKLQPWNKILFWCTVTHKGEVYQGTYLQTNQAQMSKWAAEVLVIWHQVLKMCPKMEILSIIKGLFTIQYVWWLMITFVVFHFCEILHNQRSLHQ